MPGTRQDHPPIERQTAFLTSASVASSAAFARAAGRDEAGLRSQDNPVRQHFQMVGAQRRTGRRDVDDHIGRTGGGRALRRPEAFDDAVNLDAVHLGEELLGEPPVFGGDPEPATVTLAEVGGDIVQIGHRIDIQPDFRHRHHHVGAAEAETRHDLGARLPVGPALAQKILAGNAEVDIALAEFAGDFGGREEGHLDVVASGDAGAVFALVAWQADRQAGRCQHFQRLLAQPALRRNGERDAHRPASRSASMRSSQTEKPTPAIGFCAPSKVRSRS